MLSLLIGRARPEAVIQSTVFKRRNIEFSRRYGIRARIGQRNDASIPFLTNIIMDMTRPYRPSDMTACLDIFDGNTPKFFSPAERGEFEQFLTNYAVAWEYQVIERNGILVACGGHAIDKDAKSFNFCWGMVASNLHGTGLGKMLTWARLAAASALNDIAIVRLDTSQYTQSFYAQFGFLTERIIHGGYGPGLDQWEMVLDLTNFKNHYLAQKPTPNSRTDV